MISVKSLSAAYNNKIAIKNINAEIKKGTINVILGRNGSGKSTLLKCIAKQITPCLGSIHVIDKLIEKYSNKEYAKVLSYLKQSRDLPVINVEGLVLHGRFPHMGFPRKLTKNDRDIAEYAMNQTGVFHLKDKMLSELSGGECQKVYIAMALAQDCPILILDEPTTYLDIRHQLELLNLILKLKERGKTIVTVLHDINSALQIADVVFLLDNGELYFSGTPKEAICSNAIDKVFCVNTVVVNNGEHIYFKHTLSY